MPLPRMRRSTVKKIMIHGKEYVPVAERVQEFYRLYPKGEIHTQLISPIAENPVWVRAEVFPRDGSERYCSGYSQASWEDKNSVVNRMAALENAETSAVGRALGFLGIGSADSIASAEEIEKATRRNSGREIPNEFEVSTDQRARLQNIIDQFGISDEAKARAHAKLSNCKTSSEAERFIGETAEALHKKYDLKLTPELESDLKHIKNIALVLEMQLGIPHLKNVIKKLTDQQCDSVKDLEKYPQYISDVRADFDRRTADKS